MSKQLLQNVSQAYIAGMYTFPNFNPFSIHVYSFKNSAVL